MEDMDEIVQEFLVESLENLDQLDRDLVALEREPGSGELLSRIFRTIHTIKGTSGFLAFSRLEAVTHAGENLLGRLRDGVLTLSPEMAGVLLDMVDTVRSILAEIEHTGHEGDRDHGRLIAVLNALQDPPPEEATVETTPRVGEVLVEQGVVDEDQVALALTSQDLGDPRRLGEILADGEGTTTAAVEAAIAANAEDRGSLADSTIRVDVKLLDRLMNVVGELVLARNQIVQEATVRGDAELLRSSRRLDLIAGELQDGVMRTRMQPIDTVWSKLPRVVRDLAHQLGKSVRVEMEGLDTELDRTILESVKDPLTHLVRNAIGHGIEDPRVRAAAGKSREGVVTLRAFHESGQVHIEIRDDGAGIDVQRVREQAVVRGVVSADDAATLGDCEALNLIFAPGFSTAEEITNVSGRGVGMDVVKTNIERLGGLVDVESTRGEGTTVRIKLPLTLAIISALLVVVEGKRFVVPQVNLIELFRLEGDVEAEGLEWIHGAPVFRLRGQLLPLVSLRWQLELGQVAMERSYVAVLQADGRRFGLVVDKVEDTGEIVVKPLSTALRQVPVYAGATILADGEVALILDPVAIAQRAGIDTRATEAVAEPEPVVSRQRDDLVRLLLVGLRDGRRLGVPLASVDRLEEVTTDRIERVANQDVVQYRDQILPLVRLDSLYASGDTTGTDAVVHVVVCEHEGSPVGFVVDAILDIVDAEISVRSPIVSGGRLGSAVVDGAVTELLDVGYALSALDDGLFAAANRSVTV